MNNVDILTEAALDHHFRVTIGNGGYIVAHVFERETDEGIELVGGISVFTDIKTCLAFLEKGMKDWEGDGTELKVPSRKS